MSKQKNVEDDRLEVELNSELLDQFTEELETAINNVCKANATIDPRLELLVTLGLLAAQVSQDSKYPKEDFLSLMSDLFDDMEEASNNNDEDGGLDDDDLEMVLPTKKGNQFDLN